MEYLKYTNLVHIQYFLWNIKDNTHSESDFLLDINLPIIFLYTIIYSEVMSDFTLATTNL